MLSLMAAMAFVAIGTIAVYASGTLKLANSYSGFDLKVNWNAKEVPQDLHKVLVKVETELDGQKFGEGEIFALEEDGWSHITGIDDPIVYELDENGKPVFHPLNLKVVGAYKVILPGEENYVDLEEDYKVTHKIVQTPVTGLDVSVENDTYQADGYKYSIELTVDDKDVLVAGELQWDNVPEADRPSSVVVNVVDNDGEVIASQEVTADMNWLYNISIPAGLEKYEVQVEVPGCTVAANGDNMVISKVVTTPEKEPEAAPQNNAEVTPVAKAPAAKAPAGPQTGDEANVTMWLAIASMALVVFAVAGKKLKANN